MKHFSTLTLASTSLLLLAACQFPPQTTPEDGDTTSSAMMEKSSEAMMEKSSDAMMEGSAMSEDAMMEKSSDAMMEDKSDDSMMKSSDAMMEDDKMMEDDSSDSAAAAVQYTAYTDGVIGNGQTSVLFFHASWCPYCQANDGRLKGWYSGGANPTVSTYKVDYDTATALKSQFGVVQQDTYVLIDGEGNVLKLVSFPTESALKALISA